MIDSYPVVHFSERLVEIFKQKPPLQQKPNAPIKPLEPINKSESTGFLNQLLSIVLVIAIIVVIISISTSQIQNLLISCAVAGIALFILNSIANSDIKKDKENRNMNQLYKEKNKQYEKEILIYKKDLEDYESQIKILTSLEYIDKYRNELLLILRSQDEQLFKDLSKTQVAITNAAVSFFAPFLFKSFGIENVLQMIVLENFFLHFIVRDNSGIIINIEIDEPYYDNTGVPKNSINDLSENNYSKISYFRKKNITSITFAEEQIFKYPNECIEYILQVNKLLLENIKDKLIEFPYKLPMWTDEQAHSMAFMRYRNSYIPEKYQELLKFESLLMR